MLDTTLGEVLLALFVLTNLGAFFVMALDKRRAARGQGADRTPEGFLFFLAAAFGSIGVWLGMFAFRHKTRKWYFRLGIPLLMLQNAATVYAVWTLFG
jgi:uncharacterized membrane protein YsdA (DUF1294 family)